MDLAQTAFVPECSDRSAGDAVISGAADHQHASVHQNSRGVVIVSVRSIGRARDLVLVIVNDYHGFHVTGGISITRDGHVIGSRHRWSNVATIGPDRASAVSRIEYETPMSEVPVTVAEKRALAKTSIVTDAGEIEIATGC